MAESEAREPLEPRPWVVRETTQELADVHTLRLEPTDGTPPIDIRPGQFNMLYAFGAGEVPISASAVTTPDQLVHSIRAVGRVTEALCRAQPGDVIGVRGPFGSVWPIEEQTGGDLILVAGGIGLAPLRPVIQHVLNHRDEYDEVVVLYGVREPRELLFTDEFDAWRDAGIQLDVTVDNATLDWPGHVGVVTTLIRHGKFEAEEASAFICGPEVMMRFTAQELGSRGVDPAKTFISMERNMKCAIGFCGHCQLSSEFICLDGPVFAWPRMRDLIQVREL